MKQPINRIKIPNGKRQPVGYTGVAEESIRNQDDWEQIQEVAKVCFEPKEHWIASSMHWSLDNVRCLLF